MYSWNVMEDSWLQTNSAEQNFKRALLAFAEGDYDDARRYAALAQEEVWKKIQVARFGLPTGRLVSIIVVFHNNVIDDSTELLHDLASLSQDYQIIIVDNGAGLDCSHLENLLKNFCLIEVGFNYGCSGGRNLGAIFSESDYVIFLDDDGVIENGAVQSLLDTIRSRSAIAVRGRVIPKHNNGIAGSHYDLGDRLAFAPPTTEGISAWNRAEFLKQGGFDTLLRGHEGMELYSKLYRFFGPESFIYDPRAVLRHDYACDQDQLQSKKKLQESMQRYLSVVSPATAVLRESTQKLKSDERILYLREKIIYAKEFSSDAGTSLPISVLATSKNSSQFIHEFSDGLRAQTSRDFEIVFVDDGSVDGSDETIERLWADDTRLKLIRTAGIGRAAALNSALEHANHDLCIIADVDDISMPERLETTARFFQANSVQCLAFNTFDEARLFVTPKASTPSLVGIRTRSLLGMPVAFPTFAFLRSKFTARFDEALSAAVDCDWIHRNLREDRSLDGKVFPLNMVYRRAHADQISQKMQALQIDVAMKYANEAQNSLIEGSHEADNRMCLLLGGWEEPQSKDIRALSRYVSRLLIGNLRKEIYDQQELELMLADRLNFLKNKALSDQASMFREVNTRINQNLEAIKKRPVRYVLSRIASRMFGQNGEG